MDKIKHLENKYSIARYDLIRDCSEEELRFYLYLKLYAINKHEAFPTYTTIGSDLGWGRMKISRVIKAMVKKGRLKIGKLNKAIKGVKQIINIYDITWYDHLNEQGKGRIKEEGGSNKMILPFKQGGSNKIELEQVANNITINNMSPKATDWDFNKTLEAMTKDTRRHIQIIALYWKAKGMKFENEKQYQPNLKRELRPAMALAGYKDEDIQATISVLKNTPYLTKWTAETIAKFIPDIVSNKKQEGPKILKYDQITKPDGTIVMRAIYEKKLC